ncbi:hypothetical protein D3C84_816880 [compost metagenome]
MGLTKLLIRLDQAEDPRPAGQTTRPTGVQIVRAQRLEFMGQAAHIRVMQHVRTGLQTRDLQTAGRTQVLINPELAEAVDVHHAIHLTPTVSQLKQCAHAQTSKRKHSAGFQHPMGFTEHRREVCAPLHRQAGEDQITSRILQWQPLGIPGDEVRGPAQWPRVIEHAFGDVQRHAVTARKTLTQHTTEMPGATAQVQPATRHEIFRQTAQQLAADVTLQFGHAVVAGRRTGKGRRHLAFVRQAAGQVGKG